MGSRDFQTYLYYHYLGMTYRSKIILLDGFRSKHIIIKVLDYVIGDFKGPIGRKTYSLLRNEIVSSQGFSTPSKRPIRAFRLRRKDLLGLFDSVEKTCCYCVFLLGLLDQVEKTSCYCVFLLFFFSGHILVKHSE